jgi:hypothetical protein
MKKIIYSILLASFPLFIFSCKKTEEEKPVYQQKTKADDASARSEMQRAYDDIETVYNSTEYENASTSSLRTSGTVLPCGKVTFDKKNFTIDYSQSGSNCNPYRVISGSIDVTLISGTTFSDQNAKLKVVFTNYKVLYTNSNQSVIYNGTAYITNASGGSLITLFTNTPNAEVIHKVRGDMTLTFDTTGTNTAVAFTRSWKIFRKRTFQNTPGTETGITFKLEGDTSFASADYFNNGSGGNFTNVSEIGLNTENEKFVCDVTTPFKWYDCGPDYYGPYVLKQGKVEYTSYTAKPVYVALGYTKFYWSGEAGYRYDNAVYTYDGSCNSAGYKIDFSLRKASDNSAIYSASSYIPY